MMYGIGKKRWTLDSHNISEPMGSFDQFASISSWAK